MFWNFKWFRDDWWNLLQEWQQSAECGFLCHISKIQRATMHISAWKSSWKLDISTFLDVYNSSLIIRDEFILCSCGFEISQIKFTDKSAQPLSSNKTKVRKVDKNARVRWTLTGEKNPKTYLRSMAWDSGNFRDSLLEDWQPSSTNAATERPEIYQ